MGQSLSIDQVVLDLYDAAVDPARWSPMATKVAALFDSPSAAVQVQNPTTGYVGLFTQTQNFSAASVNAYREHYWRKSVLLERAARAGMGRAHIGFDLIEESVWCQTEILREFLDEHGVFHVLGAVFPAGPDTIGAIGVHRPRRANGFQEHDRRKLDLLLGHVQRAVAIHRRLNAEDLAREGTIAAFERSGTALVVVDRAARLLYAAPEAERLLQTSIDLTAVAGRVVATNLGANHRLTKAIQGAAEAAAGTAPPAGAVVAVPRRDGPPLCVVVVPFRPQREPVALETPAALLLIRDPLRATDMTAALRELFGLTPTEAAVAAAMVNGRSLQAVAASHGVTLNTVRSQLKAVTLKTGTRRQSDLVALILRSLNGVA